MKLNIKLLLILLEIALIPMLFLGFVAYSNIKKEIITQELSKLGTLASIQKARLENSNRENLERLALLTSRVQLRTETENYIKSPNKTSQEKISVILSDAVKDIPSIKTISVAELNGDVIAATDTSLIGTNQKATEYFTMGRVKNTPTIFAKDYNNDLSIYSAGPLILDGKIIGVLVVNSDGANITSVVTDYTGLGATEETLLVRKDTKGEVLFLTRTRFDPKAALTRTVAANKSNTPSAHAVTGEEILMTEAVDYRDIPVLAATRYIPSLRWGIVSKINKDEAYIPIEKLRKLLFFITSISSIIVAMIAFSLAKSLSDPLKKLTDFSKVISNGDLSKKIRINSHDEIGQLATSFNEMTEKLQNLYQNLYKNLEEKVKQRTTELSARVIELENTKKATLNLLEDLQEGKEQIVEGNAKMETLIESLPVGVSVAEAPSGELTMINKAGMVLLGRGISPKAEKEDYTQVYDVIKPDGTPYPYDEMTSVVTMRSGEIVTKDNVVIKKPDGTKIQLRVTSVPVKTTQGETSTVVSIFEDITKEKDIDRMKTEFISLASHQLRTPLSAMKWFSEMLLHGDAGVLNAEQEEMVKNIEESNERMIELVNSLLNVSRIESGRIIIEPIPTDIKELLVGVQKDIQAKLNERHQTLLIDVPADLEKVNLDAKLIRQVFMNLLTNAIKYSPERGEIDIVISKKDDQLISKVSDIGFGIPEKDKKKVFQKFYRGENIIKVVTDGNGLGLYLVKAIIESSGGKIWFESIEGKGTSFWFSLPMSGMVAKKGEVTLDS